MSPRDVVLSVPEIRDYTRINDEVAQRLNDGADRIVLEGVEGQRLLVSRLTGSWNAIIEVAGNAGPELAAETNAPGLTIVVRGNVGDGAGRGLKAGRVIIQGSAGSGLGYAQRGGILLVQGSADHRVGLMQAGGLLVVIGQVGRLAGERQSGGSLIVPKGRCGPHSRRGRLGGRFTSFPLDPLSSPDARSDLESAIEVCGEWLPPGAFD